MVERKRLYILLAGFIVIVFIMLAIAQNNPFSTTPENNSYYERNPVTGGVDFVDPDQTPEDEGEQKVSLRNGSGLLQATSVNFYGELAERISEFYITEYPEESEIYIDTETLEIDGNRSTFEVFSQDTETRIFIEAFHTRQDTATVYINGLGPYSESYPYFFDVLH